MRVLRNLCVIGALLLVASAQALGQETTGSIEVTAKDPQGRPTVISLVRSDERLYPVGRLDYDTTGLILVTNDGDLAHRLTHPSFEVPRTYRARVANAPVNSLIGFGILLLGVPAFLYWRKANASCTVTSAPDRAASAAHASNP